MTIALTTWGHLDEANKLDFHYQSKLPKHPDYPEIFIDWVNSKHDHIEKATAYENGDMSVTISEVLELQSRFHLCDDALTYIWALEHGEDCTCQPNQIIACFYCRLQEAYNNWKKGKNDG